MYNNSVCSSERISEDTFGDDRTGNERFNGREMRQYWLSNGNITDDVLSAWLFSVGCQKRHLTGQQNIKNYACVNLSHKTTLLDWKTSSRYCRRFQEPVANGFIDTEIFFSDEASLH